MLEDLTPPKKLKWCKVKDVLDSLEATDQKILQEALDDYNAWPHSILSKSLKQKGLYLADVTIARHRDGDCRCHQR